MNPELIKPRMPRHEAINRFALEIERPDTDSRITATISNISRNGMQCSCHCCFEVEEQINLHICLEKIGYSDSHPGIVRWVDDYADGRYEVGVLFDRPLPLEVLGELILLGVLNGGDCDG